ncbi:MAG: HEPN domain-containing protein [Armatimonadetes bacterium]|nr:HEPN domain-containing protein [Armatimonadota bacterium]
MATWQDYLAEARRFREAAEIVYDPQHVNQALSSIILAAIAANDALCLALMGAVPGGDSHARAAREMQEACKGTRHEAEAARRARQLAEVLEHKTAVQYRGQPVRPETAERLMKQAQRFMDWVEDVLAEEQPPR